jgi:hypothetical protein
MPELPHIDEHSIEINADADAAWQALLGVVERSMRGGAASRGARLLGCADVAASGPRPLAQGSTFPGFHVTAASPGRELRLEGSHRFSRYALIFRLDELSAVRTRVRAETRAVFPGMSGKIYRALVIGTRGHVFAVRRLLEPTKRRAEG